MASIGQYNISALKGDTFNGLQMTLVKDGVAIDLTGATIKMDIRKDSKTGTSIDSRVTSDGITILDAVNGVLQIDAFKVLYPVGKYYYDLQITFAAGNVKTYIEGTFTVTQDVTK